MYCWERLNSVLAQQFLAPAVSIITQMHVSYRIYLLYYNSSCLTDIFKSYVMYLIKMFLFSGIGSFEFCLVGDPGRGTIGRRGIFSLYILGKPYNLATVASFGLTRL